ncbi:hypothetical protein SEUCBS140593_002013 [Sporothrix eucalyptigena]|uniref:Fumarylacetoacetase-like C-terminal domain-containing protein n=1 Tax=Sporothrix eucalyptigena TaxID=1812306 RepID=A0ABP0B370_9PEZI
MILNGTGLVRFVPRSSASAVFIGQPVDASVDVGLAVRHGEDVRVELFSGSSVLAAGTATGKFDVIDRILSPLSVNEVGTIRCIGLYRYLHALQYKQHAAEVKMDIPTIPTVFLKPNTALGDPWPAPTILPKLTQETDTGDYESELAIVIGKTAKNVSEANAMDYVLGYTAANDVSNRDSQLSQSQWCFSKGFDGACPIGPVLVSKELVPDPSKLTLRGLKNSTVLQDCGINDLIFSVPKIIKFLSQSTTLLPGTVILTGTPAGVGMGRTPKETLRAGDEFSVEILPHIGTLVNVFENEV